MSRMTEAVDRVHQEVLSNWYRRRSALLDLGETALLGSGPAGIGLPPWASSITIRDTTGMVLVQLEAPARPEAIPALPVPQVVTVYEPSTGRQVGQLEVEMALSALMDPTTAQSVAPGAVLAVYDVPTMVSYLPLPFPAQLLEEGTFELQGERWRSSLHADPDVGLTIAAAAPVSSILAPIESAARSGLRVLIGVTVGILILVALLVRPILESVRTLTVAAEDVARGSLNQTVPTGGSDEISRLGEAFNRMTSTLKQTMRRLGEQEGLAAVGEFAASLSHDIRNALTSIRVDLQLIGERAADDEDLSRIQSRALRRSNRLSETVTAALDLARSGHVRMDEIDVRSPLERAIEATAMAANEQGCTVDLQQDGDGVSRIRGDGTALERLFSNLLLNAVQASRPGSSVKVRLLSSASGVDVEVNDQGSGFPEAIRSDAFRPLVSGRDRGTGMGLAIADRIVRSHGGSVEIVETGPGGTRIRVTLPAA
jgi:signal transduction histidine kinase